MGALSGRRACAAGVIAVMAFGVPAAATIAGPARAGDAAATAARTWPSRPSPSAADPRDVFDGVSCVSPTACVAVGQRTITTRPAVLPLTERWNGRRWVILATPGMGGLDAVSCSTRSACVALGGSLGAEAWNGATWVSQRVPGPALAGDALFGVSCTSRRACTAAGYYDTSEQTGTIPLVDRWNGRTWVRQPTPALVGFGGFSTGRLHGVSCGSRTNCVAVGDYQKAPGTTLVPLVEAWNGTRWTVQAAPSPSPAGGELDGVWCGSADACVAVGWSGDYRTSLQALAVGWNGSTWAVQPAPSEPFFLSQVSCSSASACTAIGYRDVPPLGTGGFQALTERWDGSTWAIQQNLPASGNVFLAGVSCSTASSCTAVGFRIRTGGRETLLAEHWNGTSWASQRTPAPAGS
jgi:hypothetical protein